MEALNSIDLFTPLRIVRPSDLTLGGKYQLTNMYKSNTKHGEALSVNIMMGDEKVHLYLPKAYCDKVTDDQIEEINKSSLNLVYVGPHYRTFKYEFQKRE